MATNEKWDKLVAELVHGLSNQLQRIENDNDRLHVIEAILDRLNAMKSRMEVRPDR